MGTARRAGAEGRGPGRAESTLPSSTVSKNLKADGSRDRSEPKSTEFFGEAEPPQKTQY